MGTVSFPGVKYGRGMLLTTHTLLVPWSWKSRAITLPTVWATTGPVKGTLYLFQYVDLHFHHVCRSALTSFSPRPKIFMQAPLFPRRMPKIFSSYCTPIVRSSRSANFLKFESKAPSKKLRIPEPQPVERTTTITKLAEGLDWLKLPSRCFRALIRRSNKQQLDRGLGLCSLDMWRFWRRRCLCLARLQLLDFFKSSSRTRAKSPHPWHWRTRLAVSVCISRRSA